MICLFLADGFEELEAIAPLDFLRRAGAEVCTVSVTEDRKTVYGSHKIPLIADLTLSEAPERADGVILPGGLRGVENLKASAKLRTLLERYDRLGVPFAAICAAPTVLDSMKLLRGRRVTCYPTCASEITDGAYVGGAVCEDGDLITSEGAGTASLFGLALVRAWVSEDAAQKIASGVCMPK